MKAKSRSLMNESSHRFSYHRSFVLKNTFYVYDEECEHIGHIIVEPPQSKIYLNDSDNPYAVLYGEWDAEQILNWLWKRQHES
jgi:hypothetical protein